VKCATRISSEPIVLNKRSGQLASPFSAATRDKSAFAYTGRRLAFGMDYSSKTSLPIQQIIVAYQKIQPSAEGANVLYLDMHVEFDEWNATNHRIDQTQALLRTLQGK
jgi:hypothetical protein